MLPVSLNLRGVGAALKMLALRRLLKIHYPEMIFLQETMTTGLNAREFLWRFLPNWDCAATDSTSLSGGLLAAWNPRLLSLHSFRVGGGILLIGKHRELGVDLQLYNCYAPYLDRQTYWDALEE